MRYAEYDSWLQGEYSKITLEPNCIEAGFLRPTVTPNKPPWQMKWAVIFGDGKYFCAIENWPSRSVKFGGAGYREHFSFHYGIANLARDSDGIPLRSPDYPAIFRIDQDRNGPHIHFGGKDHIGQDRVDGFTISDAEPFQFVQAVLQHRATGGSFDKIMQFTVTS